jgi:hypothetical protein
MIALLYHTFLFTANSNALRYNIRQNIRDNGAIVYTAARKQQFDRRIVERVNQRVYLGLLPALGNSDLLIGFRA